MWLGRAFFLRLLAPEAKEKTEDKDYPKKRNTMRIIAIKRTGLTSDRTDNRNLRTVLLLAYLQPL